ncbi:hypothetical protein C8A05DRAFT_34657 [Staphylotrichum tortipilum]|uniref:Uncharacterized protein n=1 Tax=Staphylotrichum tortipilum TaxID=2831512 RepID=A0AAN6RSS9_9PEZI|nr:hypothetical protein C8A05DRAFT_34657 [Staphylotrichum longicolle]
METDLGRGGKVVLRNDSDKLRGGTMSLRSMRTLLFQFLASGEMVALKPASGRRCLTVNLALWWLAHLATDDPNGIDYSYPSLGSWGSVGKGKGHNPSTSGKRQGKPPSGSAAYPPTANPSGPSGVSQQPSAADAGWETSEIVVNTGKPSSSSYYYDYEGEAGPSTNTGTGTGTGMGTGDRNSD